MRLQLSSSDRASEAIKAISVINCDRSKSIEQLSGLNILDKSVVVPGLLQGGRRDPIDGDEFLFISSSRLSSNERSFFSSLSLDNHQIEYTSEGVRFFGQSVVQAKSFCIASFLMFKDASPKFLTLPLGAQLSMFLRMSLWSSKRFTTWAKFVTAYPIARYLNDVLPVCPDFPCDPIVYTGHARRYIISRLRIVNHRNTSLWCTQLLGVKGACETVDNEYIRASLAKHAKLLSSPSPRIDTREVDSRAYARRLVSDLKPIDMHYTEANNHSCYQTTRAKGGTRGYIQRFVNEHYHGKELLTFFVHFTLDGEFGDHYRDSIDGKENSEELITEYWARLQLSEPLDGNSLPPSVICTLTSRDKHGTSPIPFLRIQDILLNRKEIPMYLRPSMITSSGGDKNGPERISFRFTCWKDEGSSPELANDILGEVPSWNERLSEEIRGFTMPEIDWWVDKPIQPMVKVSAVLEPLKVRIITAGDGISQFLSQPLQRHLHTYMRSFEQFALTNRPLDVVDLEWVQRRTNSSWGALTGVSGHYDPTIIKQLNLKIVSGDYSAATDGLNLNHTKAVFETILDTIGGSEWHDRWRSVLYEQKISYKSAKKALNMSAEELKEVPDQVEQTIGQLMGSVLSFPMLCFLNLMTFWAAWDEYWGLKTPSDPHMLPVKVNGDDILFFTDDRLYNTWIAKTKEIGFTLSLGKNYVHKSFAMVNSQPYWLQDDGKFRRIPFLKLGLMIGKSKLSAMKKEVVCKRNPETGQLPIADFYNFLIENSFDKESFTKEFISRNRTLIDKVSLDGLINLGLPKSSGGLGFNLPSYEVTRHQRKLANYIRHHVQDKIDEQSRMDQFASLGIYDRYVKDVSLKLPFIEWQRVESKQLIKSRFGIIRDQLPVCSPSWEQRAWVNKRLVEIFPRQLLTEDAITFSYPPLSQPDIESYGLNHSCVVRFPFKEIYTKCVKSDVLGDFSIREHYEVVRKLLC